MTKTRQLAFVTITVLLAGTEITGQESASDLNQQGVVAKSQLENVKATKPKIQDREVLDALSANDALEIGGMLSNMVETKSLPQSALPRLIELLRDDRAAMKFEILVPVPAPTVGELAADVLTQYGTDAIPVLEPKLKSDNENELLLVFQIVSGIGPKANRLEKTLVEFANSSNSDVVKCAAISTVAAVSTNSLETSIKLVKWLDDKSAAVRGIAIHEIGNLRNSNEDVVKRVAMLLNDEEVRPFASAPDVRGVRAVKWDAVCALGKIAGGNDAVYKRLLDIQGKSKLKFEKRIINKALETMATNAK